MDERRIEETVRVFYRTWRAGASRLSDGGGPFGFDIVLALLADDLITGYGCDAIAETGCFAGDTTAYLARRYPGVPVYACDTDPGCCDLTRHRLAGCSNVTVWREDSPAMLARVQARHTRVLAYLDAHWGQAWPLRAELDTLAGAVAVIHDFDIGHPRFSFDTYDGVACGPGVLARMKHPPDRYFTLDPGIVPPVPCLQAGRRAGAGVIAAGLPEQPLEDCPYLAARQLSPAGTPAAAAVTW